MDDRAHFAITGGPSDAEAAAIVAAIEATWPRPQAAGGQTRGPSTSWRFSGRWWASHDLARRPRPGR